mgnify:CR=1 FL=1
MASLLKFQTAVRVPWVCYIAAATVNAANVLGLKADMLVTSGNDKIHMKKSKHYSDEALDFRTKHLAPAEKTALRNEVKRRLGKDFDAILEDEGGDNEHLHVEYDPK